MKEFGHKGSKSMMINQIPNDNLSDISNLKATAIALLESQQLYADLVSNQSAGIYRILVQKLENGKSILESVSIEFVSDRFLELAELRRSEFMNNPIKAIFNRIHPDDLTGFITSNELAQKSLEPYIQEIRLVIGQKIKWVRFESNPRKLVDGSSRWTGVLLDITAQKQAEEVVRINEEKYRMLLELATDAFSHGDNMGNFIFVNSVAIEQTGFSRDELLRMNMKDLFSAETLKESPLKFDELRNGGTAKTERELIRKDGKTIIVEMTSRMMPDGTFQSFSRNVTDRKMIENALKQRLSELEIYYELAITRERKMIALKSEINLLLEQLGEKAKY